MGESGNSAHVFTLLPSLHYVHDDDDDVQHSFIITLLFQMTSKWYKQLLIIVK